MTAVNLPRSGPVAQFFPWTNYITINVGELANPDVEKEAICKASYGMQLGRIGDALVVLLNHVKLDNLSPHERDAIRDLKIMLHDIANVKEKHGAKLVLRPT